MFQAAFILNDVDIYNAFCKSEPQEHSVFLLTLILITYKILKRIMLEKLQRYVAIHAFIMLTT